nr:hypothetical protein [Kibdelosporangium sp. MJ126-NF4]CTQ98157.1 hypothetical protein [Kibdelosporangium sp. MJ126-NF4]
MPNDGTYVVVTDATAPTPAASLSPEQRTPVSGVEENP